jgi:hypothetical protein
MLTDCPSGGELGRRLEPALGGKMDGLLRTVHLKVDWMGQLTDCPSGEDLGCHLEPALGGKMDGYLWTVPLKVDWMGENFLSVQLMAQTKARLTC